MAQGKSMADIAREAGVSVATVSRVLNGKQNVRPDTAARIAALIERYHFRPNAMARSLYTRRSNVLTLVLPDLTNPYYGQLFTSAEREAKRLGRSLEMTCHPRGQSLDAEMAARMIERRLDGVILNGEFIDDTPGSPDLSLLSDLKTYMPVVLIGNLKSVEGYKTITLDLASGARPAVEYLYRLGHRRIALLCGRDGEDHPASRRRGFLDALAARGLPTEGACFPEDDTAPGGQRALFAALSSPHPPTAAVCANDLSAMGAMRAAQTRGLKVPGDLSLIGCDNSYLCDFLPAPLTSIDIRTDDLARCAVRMALSEEAENERVFTGSLVIRQSCAPPN